MYPNVTVRFNLGESKDFPGKSGFITGDITTIIELCFISMQRRVFAQRVSDNQGRSTYTLNVVSGEPGNDRHTVRATILKRQFETLCREVGSTLIIRNTDITRYGSNDVVGNLVNYHIGGVDKHFSFLEMYFRNDEEANEFRAKKDPRYFGDEITSNIWIPEVYYTTTPHYEHKEKCKEGNGDRPRKNSGAESKGPRGLLEFLESLAKDMGGSVKVIHLGDINDPTNGKCPMAPSCQKARSCQYGSWAFNPEDLQQTSVAFTGKVDENIEGDTPNPHEDDTQECRSQECGHCCKCDDKRDEGHCDCEECHGCTLTPIQGQMLESISSIDRGVMKIQNTLIWAINQINDYAQIRNDRLVKDLKHISKGRNEKPAKLSKGNVKKLVRKQIHKHLEEYGIDKNVEIDHQIAGIVEELADIRVSSIVMSTAIMALINLVTGKSQSFAEALAGAESEIGGSLPEGAMVYPHEMNGIFAEIAEAMNVDASTFMVVPESDD